MSEGVGASNRKPYSGRPHQSHCSCFYKVQRQQQVSEAAREARALVDMQAEDADLWLGVGKVEYIRKALRELATAVERIPL